MGAAWYMVNSRVNLISASHVITPTFCRDREAEEGRLHYRTFRWYGYGGAPGVDARAQARAARARTYSSTLTLTLARTYRALETHLATESQEVSASYTEHVEGKLE